MGKIGIFYFSGTGNTQYCAGKLKDALIERGTMAEIIAMEEVIAGKLLPAVNSYDVMGFACPVYGMNMPAVVDDFLARLPQGGLKRAFIMMTGADPGGINAAATLKLRNKLHARGYNVYCEKILAMPSNFGTATRKDIAEAFLLAVPKKCGEMADVILAGRRRLLHPPLKAKLISTLAKGIRWGSMIFGKSLYATDACTRCGICIDNCPRNNITSQDKKLCFGNACTMCMRCVYICPQKAIASKYLNKVILAEGYDVSYIAGKIRPGMEISLTEDAPTHIRAYLGLEPEQIVIPIETTQEEKNTPRR